MCGRELNSVDYFGILCVRVYIINCNYFENVLEQPRLWAAAGFWWAGKRGEI